MQMSTALATRTSATPYRISKELDLIRSDEFAELPERVVRDPVLDVRAQVKDPIPLAEASPAAEALDEGHSLLELAMGRPTV